MNWMTVLQSTVSGLAYFGLYAIGFYLFHLARNRRLEHQLRQMIQPKEVNASEERAHLVILNETHVDVTIRGVCLVGENDDAVRLDYVGDTGDFMNDLQNVERRDRVSYALEVGKKAGLQERDFVHLPQQTGGLWLLKTEEIESKHYTFNDCFLVVEYPTIFRNHRLLKIHASPQILSKLQREYEDFISQLNDQKRSEIGKRNNGTKNQNAKSAHSDHS